MPMMPFNLEKGHALGAVEELLNDPTHAAALHTVFTGLGNGTPLGAVFQSVIPATLNEYGKNPIVTTAGGLGNFVTGAWFGQPGDDKTPSPYWLDYRGDVDGIVRTALLYAMGVAWGATVGQSLPSGRSRRIELWWHCGQRWFDAWVTWADDDGPVQLLFATPPHTAGDIVANVGTIVDAGDAHRIPPAVGESGRDMVLITEPNHVRRVIVRDVDVKLGWSDIGIISLPTIGDAYDGKGPVGIWRIDTNAGGISPKAKWK